jgi:hypothetical protein
MRRRALDPESESRDRRRMALGIWQAIAWVDPNEANPTREASSRFVAA